MRFLKKRKKEILLLGITLVLMLCIAEYLFRANGTYACYNERAGGPYISIFTSFNEKRYNVYEPHQSITTAGNTEFSYTTTSNSEGLLDREFSTGKDSGHIKVMVFGDSFVQGMGAPYDSSGTQLAQHVLNIDSNKKAHYEILNCGVCGSDPYYNFVLFRDRLLRYHPDIVILAVNSTDISDIIIRGGMERFSHSAVKRAPFYEPLYAHSYIFRHILHDVLRYDWMFVPPARQPFARAQSIGLINSVIDSFAEVCHKQHISFGVLLQPLNYECIPNDIIHPFIQAHCLSAHIPVSNLQGVIYQSLRSASDREKLYWRVDGHFNSTGYKYYGEGLASFIHILDNDSSFVYR